MVYSRYNTVQSDAALHIMSTTITAMEWNHISISQETTHIDGLMQKRRKGYVSCINSLWPSQNGRHFADDTFKRIFMNENMKFRLTFHLRFVPKGVINNIPALVQIMAWRRPGDKPLSEPMMVNLLTHICVTRPQWVKSSTSGPRGLAWLWIYIVRTHNKKNTAKYSRCWI